MCVLVCASCAYLTNVIRHCKYPLQYMLDESTPSNSAKYDPPAHITVVVSTFNPVAQANVSLLSFTMLYPNVLFLLASSDALSSHMDLVF